MTEPDHNTLPEDEETSLTANAVEDYLFPGRP